MLAIFDVFKVLEPAFKHKVSLVWGPAATGKSEVLARIIVETIRRDPSERILCCAPRNIPVDSLLQDNNVFGPERP